MAQIHVRNTLLRWTQLDLTAVNSATTHRATSQQLINKNHSATWLIFLLTYYMKYQEVVFIF